MRRRPFASLVTILAAVCVAPPTHAGSDAGCGDWVWANPTPLQPPVTALATNDDQFFAYSKAGVFVSRDGESWTRAGAAPAWTAVVRTDTGFVGVLGHAIGTSPDGVHWTTRFDQDPSGRGASLNDIAWNGELLVAVGSVSQSSYGAFGYAWILTSRDGVEWHQVAVPSTSYFDRLHAVVWAGSQFVVAGSDWYGEGLTLRSSDGENWVVHQGPRIRSLAWNGEVLCGFVGNTAWWSSDGVGWDQTTLPEGTSPYTVRWIGSRFVAVGSGGVVVTSPNAVVWLVRDTGTSASLTTVAGVGQTLVAAGDTLLSSRDGETWTSHVTRVLDRNVELRVAGWDGSRYVAMGRAPSQAVVALSSRDGMTWVVGPTGIEAMLNDVASNNALWVAVGNDGVIVTSADGSSWETRDAGISTNLYGVTWGEGQFVAVGDGGVVLTSSDGAVWTRQSTPTDRALTALAWGDGRFVAVGGKFRGAGIILASPDGRVWTVQADALRGSLWDVAWGGGRFVAVAGSWVYSSGDGSTWREAATPSDAYEVVWFGDRFYSLGGGSMASSLDGLTWTQEGDGGGAYLVAGERLVSVGPGSALRWRSCGGAAGPVFLPAVAHVDGANDSHWRSDVEVHNPTGQGAAVTVDLLVRGEENLEPQSRRFDLAGHTSRRIRDVLPALFDRPGAGTLRISASSAEILAGARTYNDAPAGSYGQSVPGLPLGEALEPGEVGRLLGLAQSADGARGFRTNLGLVNAVAWPLEVQVDLFADDGRLLGSHRYTLRALESIQVDGILQGYVTTGDLDGFAEVSTSTAGGRFFAYASVVDNRTGDGVTVESAVRQDPVCTAWETSLLPAADTLFDVVAGDREFVAVGAAGRILTSVDGRGWVRRSSGTTEGLQGLAWNGSTFAAVGSDGTVLTSRDGRAWTSRRSGTGEYLRGVAWTGTRFVAVGWGGIVLTSTDGSVWEERTLPGVSLDDVASDGSRTVAVGDSIVVSDDLATWTDLGPRWWQGSPDPIGRIVWTGSEFVAVGSGPLYRSADGVTWSAVEAAVPLELAAVAPMEREIVGVGYQGIATSPTGEVWTTTPAPEGSDLVALAWDGRVAVAVGFNGIAVRRECGLAATPVSVPGAAHLRGWGESRWRTDLVVHNPSERRVGFSLSLYERDTSTGDPPTKTFQLGPGMSARYPDVLADQFQLEGAGTLRLVPLAGEVIAQSRTYDGSSGATYGASIAGLVEDRAIARGETARLIQLSESSSYRTNLGLVSVCDTPIQVEIGLYRADGALLGSRSVELRPRESIQIYRIFATVTAEEVEDGYAVVTSASTGARYLAYASVVDASTNDPVTVLARRTVR